jgi:hypothetical protein
LRTDDEQSGSYPGQKSGSGKLLVSVSKGCPKTSLGRVPQVTDFKRLKILDLDAHKELFLAHLKMAPANHLESSRWTSSRSKLFLDHGRCRVGYPRLVDGCYALAATAEERMAIAVVRALHSHALQRQEGVTPSQQFLAEYLKPFLERELLEARLDELHTCSQFRKRERELLDSRHCKLRECVERIQHSESL